MDDKIKKFLESFIDCAQKAAENFLNEKPVNIEELTALGDAVRVIHHIEKMNNN